MMTSWLATQLLPLSLLAALLVFGHPLILRFAGASTKYQLWLLLPITVLLSLLPWYGGYELDRLPMLTMAVTISQQASDVAAIDWIYRLWMAGVMCLSLLLVVINHRTLVSSQYQSISTNRLPVIMPDRVTVWQSRHTDSPFICGVFSPRLIIPADFFQHYDEREQQLILAHELCHLARFDLLVNVVALALLIAFWFNPLLWLAYFRFRKDQEIACDTQILASKDKATKVLYGKTLVKCAQGRRHFAFAALQYGDIQTMKERITQIKSNRPTSKLLTSSVFAFGLLACVSMSFAGQVGMEMKTGHQPPSPQYRMEPIYPDAAIKDHISGFVVLKFDIDAAGNVDGINIVKSQPERVFDRVATAALSQWRYHASEHGQRDTLVQLDFVLDEPQPAIERIQVVSK